MEVSSNLNRIERFSMASRHIGSVITRVGAILNYVVVSNKSTML